MRHLPRILIGLGSFITIFALVKIWQQATNDRNEQSPPPSWYELMMENYLNAHSGIEVVGRLS